jgi:Asp-tRNA(Asn)/Glu-tRNA(Gln) amidotransferase A subunit family amidase
MDIDLTYSDATRLAELIRTREVTSVEVVQAHLGRIAAVNPAGQRDRRPGRGRARGGTGG